MDTDDLNSQQQLVALPNNAWDVVLHYLCQQPHAACYLGSTAARSSCIGALAQSCRAARDVVRCVRSRARYLLDSSAESGHVCAQHLNMHSACSSVCLLCTFKKLDMGLTAFLLSAAASSPLRVQHLTISTNPKFSCSCEQLLRVADAFAGLRSIRWECGIGGGYRLFSGLPTRCPDLRSLQACVPTFGLQHMDGLSKLTRLTSLELEEAFHAGLDPSQARNYAAAAVRQVSALHSLTHLALTFAWCHDAASNGQLGDMAPLLALMSHLPLRRLGLLGGYQPSGDDLRALTALASLERLDLSHRFWLSHPGVMEQPGWHHPCLAAVCAPKCEHEDDAPYVSLRAAAALVAGCPRLRTLTHIAVRASLGLNCDGGAGSARDDGGAADADEVRRWVQALPALAQLHPLPFVEIRCEAEDEASRTQHALDHLPPEQRAVLAADVTGLQVVQEVPEAQLGALVAHLPALRVVRCGYHALPALAPLQGLKRVNDAAFGMGLAYNDGDVLGEYLDCLEEFAQRRVQLLGAAAAARRQVTVEMDRQLQAWGALDAAAARVVGSGVRLECKPLDPGE